MQLFQQGTLSALEPFYKYMSNEMWGVGRLDIMDAALGTGSFQISVGEFIFPDFTCAVINENAVCESRKFDAQLVEGGRPFTVYAGLKRADATGRNVTSISAKDTVTGINTRFVSFIEPEDVPDMHLDGPPSELRSLKYAIRIFWENERDRLGDYEIIPVAQIEKRGEEIVLSESFIPPSLNIGASSPLDKIIREIRDQIASKGFQLEGFKRDRGIHTSDFGSRDMVYLLAMMALNRYIPLFYQITESPKVHPWAAFGMLRQLIGELSCFSEKYNASGDNADDLFPKYQHANLNMCFSKALSVITALLDEITAGPEYVFALNYDGTYYSSDLPPAIFEGKNRFYLVVQSSADAAPIINSIQAGAKISSRESLPILIVRALAGVGIKRLERPPQELPRRAGALYYQIDHNTDSFNSIIKGKNIALFWDSAPSDIKVELMVTGRG
jgi:type VI secretion system protein ImpJ